MKSSLSSFGTEIAPNLDNPTEQLLPRNIFAKSSIFHRFLVPLHTNDQSMTLSHDMCFNHSWMDGALCSVVRCKSIHLHLMSKSETHIYTSNIPTTATAPTDNHNNLQLIHSLWQKQPNSVEARHAGNINLRHSLWKSSTLLFLSNEFTSKQLPRFSAATGMHYHGAIDLVGSM